MIPMILLMASLMFDVYYQLLVRKCKRMTRIGNVTDWPVWRKLKTREERLTPWTGLMRFLDPILMLWVAQSSTDDAYPWYAWVGVVLLGLVWSYAKLLRYIPRTYKALFVKSSNPHHDRKWLLGCVRNSFGHAFQSDYPRTHTFFRLGLRLLICNTIGHRWTNWEMVKYGDFGNSRKCKACLINETKHRGHHSYCETHTRVWRKVVDPNCVFRRTYIKPDN